MTAPASSSTEIRKSVRSIASCVPTARLSEGQNLRKRFAVLTVPAVIAAALTVTSAAHAPEARSIPVDIHLGTAAGSGSVQVDLEIAKNFTKLGIPQKLVDKPLATIPLHAAGTQRINVPVTSLVLRHRSWGLATYEFFAWFGDHEATAMESLPVALSPGNAASATPTPVAVPFSPFVVRNPMLDGPVAPPCVWTANGKVREKSNLIGQMQVSNSRGSSADWDYKTKADSTFGIGVSDSIDKHYSLDGHFSITNSMGGDGGFTGGPGFNRFVYGHFYRQRYISPVYGNPPQPVCGHHYKAYYPKAIGDSYPQGKKRPRKDPCGRCTNDPFGFAQMTPRTGHYNSDRGHATDYSVAATIYDLTVSGQTGYTNDIHIGYHNKSRRWEYACGNGTLPGAPKPWSNNSQGK